MKRVLAPVLFLCVAGCISLFAATAFSDPPNPSPEGSEADVIIYALYSPTPNGSRSQEEETSHLLSQIEGTLSKMSGVTSVTLTLEEAEEQTVLVELSLAEGYELSQSQQQTIKTLITTGFAVPVDVTIEQVDLAGIQQ